MLSALEPGLLNRQSDWGQEQAGYAHPSYLDSFSELAEIVRFPGTGCGLLMRPIPGTARYDAMGAYPLFSCENLDKLMAELQDFANEAVSVSVIPDPFSGFSEHRLQSAFDLAVPFKTHFLVDLAMPFDRYLRRHHRRYTARSLSVVAVKRADDPAAYAREWVSLYRHLIARRGITGLRAFSANALSRQLAVPGCHYFRAVYQGDAVGALVCYLDRGVAYAHLVSTTPVGQELMAQYALHWSAIEYFRGRARWFALGGVPGYSDQESDGLAFFKRGWATATCRTYFCAKILNRARYEELCNRFGGSATPHFPPYRAAEFS